MKNNEKEKLQRPAALDRSDIKDISGGVNGKVDLTLGTDYYFYRPDEMPITSTGQKATRNIYEALRGSTAELVDSNDDQALYNVTVNNLNTGEIRNIHGLLVDFDGHIVDD